MKVIFLVNGKYLILNEDNTYEVAEKADAATEARIVHKVLTGEIKKGG